jgi:hypothetical protein
VPQVLRSGLRRHRSHYDPPGTPMEYRTFVKSYPQEEKLCHTKGG